MNQELIRNQIVMIKLSNITHNLRKAMIDTFSNHLDKRDSWKHMSFLELNELFHQELVELEEAIQTLGPTDIRNEIVEDGKFMLRCHKCGTIWRPTKPKERRIGVL